MSDNVKLSEIKTDFTKKIIYDICKFAFLALFTLGFGYFYKSQIFTNFDWISFIVGVITAFILFVFLSVLFRYFFRKFKPDFPKLSPDFEIIETKISYIHQEQNKMVYTKKKKIKALRNGLQAYTDKYSWTGKGLLEISSDKKSQTFQEAGKRSVFQFYDVRFEKVLKKGEEIDILLTWELEDTENKSVPFMSNTIEEPTKKLIFKVVFPKTSHVSSVIREVSPYIGAKNPFSSEKVNIEEKEYEWVIDNPKLLYHYELRWKW